MSGMALFRFLLIVCSLISVNLAYAVDAQEQQASAQKLLVDLENYQVRLKEIEQDSRNLSTKTQTEFENYDELIQGLTQDIKISEKNIQSLERFASELKSKNRLNEEERKDLAVTVDTLMEEVKDVRFKTSTLGEQKDLIEENSTRLYEVLLDVRARYGHLFAELKKLEDQQADFVRALTKKNQEAEESVSVSPLTLKNLFFISFVFFIPLAFSLRDRDIASRDVVLIITISAILGYAVLGFGLKYGDSSTGWISFSNPLLMSLISSDVVVPDPGLITDFLHKMSFILLPVLIIACIINHQFSGLAHMIFAFLVSTVLVPVFGYWVWGNDGWLAQQGFVDSMGSVVINMVPAWFACMVLYRRRSVWIKPKHAQLSAYSTASALLLLLGWFGLALNSSVESGDIFRILLNILLAASMGGICGFAYHAFFESDPVSRSHRLTGGFVAGLVAIAACADVVTFLEALSIGAVAGILHNIAINLLRKTVLQPSWQAPAAQLIAIHAMGGLWGALAVGLFNSAGGFGELDTNLILVQLKGIGIALAYSTVLGLLLGKLPFLSKKQPSFA